MTGGVWLPTDGQADPTGIALALARGIRQTGAMITERVRVIGIGTEGRRVTGVDWTSDNGACHIGLCPEMDNVRVAACGAWPSTHSCWRTAL